MLMRGSVVPGGCGGVGVPDPGGGGGDWSAPLPSGGGGGGWLPPPPPPPPPPPFGSGGGVITGLPDGSQVTSGGTGVDCSGSVMPPSSSTSPALRAEIDALAVPL